MQPTLEQLQNYIKYKRLKLGDSNNLKVNRDKAINVHGALCNEPKLLHYSC